MAKAMTDILSPLFLPFDPRAAEIHFCVAENQHCPEWTGNLWDYWTKALQLTTDKTGQDSGETIKAGWLSRDQIYSANKPATTNNGEVWEPGYMWSVGGKEPVINWVGNQVEMNQVKVQTNQGKVQTKQGKVLHLLNKPS